MTAKMLEAIIEHIQVLDPDTVKIVGIVSPLAKCLLKNERFEQSQVDEVLQELQ